VKEVQDGMSEPVNNNKKCSSDLTAIGLDEEAVNEQHNLRVYRWLDLTVKIIAY
jgi:hypothetical protein